MTIIGISHYCENGDCKVELYTATVDDFSEGKNNCPGCGQFGRTKNRGTEQKAGRPVRDEPQA